MGHVACRFEGYWRKPVPFLIRRGVHFNRVPGVLLIHALTVWSMTLYIRIPIC